MINSPWINNFYLPIASLPLPETATALNQFLILFLQKQISLIHLCCLFFNFICFGLYKNVMLLHVTVVYLSSLLSNSPFRRVLDQCLLQKYLEMGLLGPYICECSTLLNDAKWFFQSVCISSYSCQQCISVCLYILQHLMQSDLIFANKVLTDSLSMTLPGIFLITNEVKILFIHALEIVLLLQNAYLCVLLVL